LWRSTVSLYELEVLSTVYIYCRLNMQFCGVRLLVITNWRFYRQSTFIAGLICSVVGFDSHLRGPSFLLEPPPRLEFSNSSGGWLDCSASGSPPPAVDWLSVDGSPVLDVHAVRRVLLNGTLILLPFAPAAYRQDIHSTVYRCVATNAVGRIVSRDVQVRAGKATRVVW